MRTPLSERPSSALADRDPEAILLHADRLREAYRRAATERKFRWVKQLRWWEDLVESVETQGWVVGN